MGKRKGRKKKRSKMFNKTQFIAIICSQCSLCGHKPNPLFCYTKIYKKEPKIFMDEIYSKLLGYSEWLNSQPFTNIHRSFIVEDFKRMFCRSEMCGDRVICQDILTCYGGFKAQFKDADERNKKKEKATKKPVVMKAYPTFFSSDDEQWRNLIKEILDDGD